MRNGFLLLSLYKMVALGSGLKNYFIAAYYAHISQKIYTHWSIYVINDWSINGNKNQNRKDLFVVVLKYNFIYIWECILCKH